MSHENNTGAAAPEPSQQNIADILLSILKLPGYGLLCGIPIGIIASLFANAIAEVTEFRDAYPNVIFLLPAGAVLIAFLYKRFSHGKTTDTVLEAARKSQDIPGSMAPLIFFSTVVSHFLGASVGREGAALQLGGSIGDWMGRRLHLDPEARRVMVMAGMSAAFSALFGTPLAAAVLALEISTVGLMHYEALLPCVIAALPAYYISLFLGVEQHPWAVSEIPAFTLSNAIPALVLAILSGLVSILFVAALKWIPQLASRFLHNLYVRSLVMAALLAALTLLIGSQAYNGGGMDFITDCLHGESAFSCAFLLKILFTAISIAACFKGGEIIPALFTGAAFGAFLGPVLGMPAGISAAICMGCMFCGVTNCPLAALLLSFEMFGFNGRPFYLLCIAIAYICSGNFGLYNSQRIRYSKLLLRRDDGQVHH